MPIVEKEKYPESITEASTWRQQKNKLNKLTQTEQIKTRTTKPNKGRRERGYMQLNYCKITEKMVRML